MEVPILQVEIQSYASHISTEIEMEYIKDEVQPMYLQGIMLYFFLVIRVKRGPMHHACILHPQKNSRNVMLCRGH